MPKPPPETKPRAAAGRLAGQIAATIACRLVLNTGRRFIYPFAPDLSRELGVPLTSITGLVAVNSATSLLGFCLGPVADRCGYRAMMILGMGALTAGMAGAGLYPVFAMLVVAQLLSGAGKSLFDPALQAYISERVPYTRRGLAIGLLETAWAGSTLAGIPLLALLIDQAGWRAAFFALSASGVLGIGLMACLLPADAPRPAGPRAQVGFRQLLAAFLRSRPALGMAVFAFFFNTAMDNLFVIYGAWLEEAFHLSVLAIGVGTSVIGAGELLGEFITAGLGDRLGLKRMAVGGVALCVLTYLLLPAASQTLPLALAALFLHFCMFEMTLVTGLSVTTELLPQARATMIASFYAAAGAGRICGALMGGPVWLAWGIWGTGLFSAALTTLALSALLYALRGWKKD
ncbi:MAG: MFS transporter [Desulfobacterales bacterium]|jgi:predicted MFS family arabinose efflux permease|nr:MFS transporter [Desulfobacterales bacterium]